MQNKKVIIIATPSLTTNLLYEGLSRQTEVSAVFIAPQESKVAIIKRRFKKLGFVKTAGQILFMLLVLPFIPRRKKRIAEILEESNLKGKSIPSDKIHPIDSIHNPALIEQINKEDPALIVINGTRIFKKAFLEQINCPIINLHVGITPKYRGVHGGYWAIHNHDKGLFGVTLHYVDRGIDTGQLIAQKVILISEEDNFKTYPILQYSVGVLLLEQNLIPIIEKNVTRTESLTDVSKLHYHPTFKAYLFGS